jgi:cell division protein FtsQ
MKSLPCASRPIPVRPENCRRGRKWLVIIIIFSSLFWGWLKIRNPDTFPVRSVKILGISNRINHQTLRNTILPYLAQGMLWLNTAELENTLNQLSWVEKAAVVRKWPDELFIHITEQKPLAYWNNTSLLNDKGDIFTPSVSAPLPVLPALYGPPQQQTTVWAGYVEMNNILRPLDLKAVIVSMTLRQVWEVYLNNGLHLFLGREDVLRRLERFASAYPKIAVQAGNIEYVDLRYTDGFAIKWKNNPASE